MNTTPESTGTSFKIIVLIMLIFATLFWTDIFLAASGREFITGSRGKWGLILLNFLASGTCFCKSLFMLNNEQRTVLFPPYIAAVLSVANQFGIYLVCVWFGHLYW